MQHPYAVSTCIHLLPSSETQAQIVGARESLNGRKNMARRKVKNDEKSPWGQYLTRPVPNGRSRSAFWLGRKKTFSGTNQKSERRWAFGTRLVRQCPQGLFSQFFTFLRAIFFRPFRLSLTPIMCPWVSEDDLLQAFLTRDLKCYPCEEKPATFYNSTLLHQNSCWFHWDLPRPLLPGYGRRLQDTPSYLWGQ